MSRARLVLVVLKKELRDGMRDRRALVSLLVFPLVGPTLVSLMLATLVERATAEHPIRLPVVHAERAPALMRYLVNEGITIVDAPADPIAEVRSGRADAVLIVESNYAEALRMGRSADVELVLDDAREDARPAVRRVQRALQVYGQTVGALRLMARGVSPDLAQAVVVHEVDLSTPQSRGAVFLNFVPLFVLMAAFIGGMHLASDVTAGERERGSFEPLLLTPVSRRVLVVGKWFAATTFAATTVVVTLACTALALSRVPLHRFGMAASLSPRDLLLVLATVLPLTPLAAAVELLVASFARTVKEAQIYLSLLTFAPMLPALYLSLQPMKPGPAMAALPVVGQQAILAAIVRGEAPTPLAFLAAGGSAMLLACVAVLATAALFRSERVVYGR